ncbi:hypothetical protein ACFO4O_07345 [Glaciecola siphonariae]|uniref:Uncharacterized protein n=1 Tax=Glaciecola siphonariae TaxID=521012 RepID=A0ABV9LUZ3_9ALTE
MKVIHLPFILFFALISVIASSHAQESDRNKEVDKAYAKLLTYLPEGAQLIHVPYADKLGSYGPNLTTTYVNDADVTGGKLIQLNVKKAGKNIWDDAVTADVGGEIKKGDVVYMMFWGRISPEDQNNETIRLAGLGIQKASPPYNKILTKDVELTLGWQTFAVAGKATEDFTNYGSQLNFPVSTGTHIIEFGPVFIFNLGPDVDMRSLPFL